MACVAFSLLLRQWGFGAWFALAGGFALSVVPWVFPPSRNCSFAGYMAGLFGLITGLILTDSALPKRSYWLAIGAGAVWAFTFYTHQSVRPILALLAVGSGVVLWGPLARRWRVVLVIALSALVFLLPMIVTAMRLPGALTARFQQVGIFTATAQPGELAVGIASHYLDYFSPRFLFISGDHQPRHHTGHGGELYWFLAPLILTGLYVAIRYWRQHASHRIVLVGILVSPVSAALTVDQMHSSRCVYAVIFWLLLAMLGVQWLWQRRGPWRKLLLFTACAGALEIALYMHDYFGAYQTRDPQALQTELTDALEYCFAHLDTNQVLYISASTYTPYGAVISTDLKPQMYADVLFFGKIDPRIYQRTGFPTYNVRLYDGHVPEPGLLLRSSNYYFKLPNGGAGFLGVPDEMPIPPNAKLIKSIPFSGQYSFAQYQVFAFP